MSIAEKTRAAVTEISKSKEQFCVKDIQAHIGLTSDKSTGPISATLFNLVSKNELFSVGKKYNPVSKRKINHYSIVKEEKNSTFTAVQIGESIIKMIENLKKENDQLWTDLSECMESRDQLQARYNEIKMSEKTLTIKDLTRG